MDKNNQLETAPIGKLVFKLAIPTVMAQLVNLLYNIVDRIYVGRIPEIGSLSLAGLGVTFPIILLVSAFAMLAGMGGASRAAVSMGEKDNDKAENSCHKYRQNFLTGHGCHCKTGSEVLQILLGLMNAGTYRTVLSGTVMILFLCDIEKRSKHHKKKCHTNKNYCFFLSFHVRRFSFPSLLFPAFTAYSVKYGTQCIHLEIMMFHHMLLQAFHFLTL